MAIPNNINSDLLYWCSSAPSKHSPQVVEGFSLSATNVFRLNEIPDFSSDRMKDLAKLRGEEYGSGFAVKLQKNLIHGLSCFGSSSLDAEIENRFTCGYSLRVILQQFTNNDQPIVDIFLIGRVAANNSDVLEATKQEQIDHIKSLLSSQPYQFEFDEHQLFDSLPDWLTNTESLSCCEILRPEEMFPWIGAEGKYFYSPGQFRVDANNTMFSLFEQIQFHAAGRKNACIDLVLVPTKIDEAEKGTIARYMETLQQAASKNLLPAKSFCTVSGYCLRMQVLARVLLAN
jgi:hypothetical protein